MTFTQSFTSMAYNITAVEQQDPPSGFGPAYLLNGLSNSGYWYQVGLSWNWDGTGTYSNYSPGFNFNYEVFDSSGNSIYPTNGGGGIQSFSGPVNEGDTVLLNLYFSNSSGVVMLAKDYNTGSTSFQTFSGEGGTQFNGSPSSTSNSNGFFTGLMTEWYHSAPFYGNISPAKYINPHYALSSAWMWIDEFSCFNLSCSNRTLLFDGSTPSPIVYANPSSLQGFSSNGATEYSDAYELVTGPAYYDLTVSYSIIGGSTSLGQPVFIYLHDGIGQSVGLTQSPSTYAVDAGSTWSVTVALGGSSSTERWALDSQSTGIAASSQTIGFEYQHQFRFFVTGGSGGANGDGWYASGSPATGSSFGVYDRSGGLGERVTSYTVDGTGSLVEPIAGLVSVTVIMTTSHQVSFFSIQQYEVSLDNGAIVALSSITQPTIKGDPYWYDAGSPVNVTLNGAWGRSSGNGSRLVSYTLNGGATAITNTTRPITVLFVSSISSYESIATTLVVQHKLLTPTGVISSVTHTPIPGDTGWYDTGTPVMINYNHSWNVTTIQSRTVATGYDINGGSVTTVSESGNGTFTIEFDMKSSEVVNVETTTQFYFAFKFTDAAGSIAIVPSNLQIQAGNQSLVVSSLSIWLDKGLRFTISNVTFGGLDVTPIPKPQFSSDKPSVIMTKLLIYDVTLKVTDLLGIPVSGAKVSITFANRTSLSGFTSGDGTFVAQKVPLGTFSASISSLGSSTQLSGDASKEAVTPVKLYLSITSLLLVSLVIVGIGAMVFGLRYRSKRRRTR